VHELRPWQWYKQLVLYLAIVFSGSAGDIDGWVRVTAGAILFSGAAGLTYVLNDISDVDEDSNHPRKKHRPIASGQVSIKTAFLFASLTFIATGFLSWRLDPLFFGLVMVYIGQNVVYSFGHLKDLLFVDLFSISSGFVIRAIAGVVLISVPLSPWIILCTFLAALMLGVSKRWGEREEVEDPSAVRENLDEYSNITLKFVFMSVATMLLMSYSLYTFFARDLAMMLTIPFAFYAVFRYAHVVFTAESASKPGLILLDRPLLLNFAAWGFITIVILYYQALL